MKKKICIVHANCQGEPLIERLNASPDFSDQYECVLYTNYTKQPIPDESLSKCDLFLYQFLGQGWNELASEALLAKLPQTAQHICIPNIFFKGYWPLWSGTPGFDYRCSHLDSLIEKGLPPEETAMLYLHSDIGKKFDLLDLVSKTLEQERERETHTPIKYLDIILDNYRSTRLMNTVNHPGSLLMKHVAKGVLSQLKLWAPNDAVYDAMDEPFGEFEQPIHPKIGKHFGWEFAKPDTIYNIYGRSMTFPVYVANYIIAAQAGVTDFIGFLQGDNIAI